jgi:PHD/YefM family antitoxin component YafN of YafNO toxin-antitoxin module
MTEPIKKKYVIDSNGKKTAVILDMKIYEKLMDEIDELNCALGYDQAKKENEKDLSAGNSITLNEFLSRRKSSKIKRKAKA